MKRFFIIFLIAGFLNTGVFPASWLDDRRASDIEGELERMFKLYDQSGTIRLLATGKIAKVENSPTNVVLTIQPLEVIRGIRPKEWVVSYVPRGMFRAPHPWQAPAYLPWYIGDLVFFTSNQEAQQGRPLLRWPTEGQERLVELAKDIEAFLVKPTDGRREVAAEWVLKNVQKKVQAIKKQTVPLKEGVNPKVLEWEMEPADPERLGWALGFFLQQMEVGNPVAVDFLLDHILAVDCPVSVKKLAASGMVSRLPKVKPDQRRIISSEIFKLLEKSDDKRLLNSVLWSIRCLVEKYREDGDSDYKTILPISKDDLRILRDLRSHLTKDGDSSPPRDIDYILQAYQ